MFMRLLSGILLVRWLAKDDYAMFTLALAIQGTTAVLVDLGISKGLVALIADRCDDSAVVGRYITAVKHYRNRLIGIGTVILFGVFWFAGNHFDWSVPLRLALWGMTVSNLWFDAQTSFYEPVYELKQRIKEIYAIEAFSALARFGILLGAWLVGVISAPIALLAGVVQSLLESVALRKGAKPFIQLPDRNETLEKEKKQTLDLSLPKVPGTVFYAFQGQVTVFLIGAFGAYSQIADLGALSKLSIILSTPIIFIHTLLVPWFSKLPQGRLVKSYCGVLALCLAFGSTLAVATWFFPQIFLYIIGDGYEGLELEVFLFGISAAVVMLADVSYSLTAVRKWVYYWTGPTSIASYIIVLMVFIFYIDLSSISNVIMLSIINSVILIILHQIVFIIGYSRMKSNNENH